MHKRMPLEFGVCTNFLETPDTDPVGMCLIPAIAEAGFQYVELPLCHVAALSDREFERLADVIHSSGLRSPAACNLFPDQMPLLGGQANPGEISAYLEHALCRASRLGIRKVVFASVSAWDCLRQLSGQAGGNCGAGSWDSGFRLSKIPDPAAAGGTPQAGLPAFP